MREFINPNNLTPETGLYAKVFEIYGLNEDSIQACQEYAMILVSMKINSTLSSLKLMHFNRNLQILLNNATRAAQKLTENTSKAINANNLKL